jgi:aerobic-type carbon monoxide dehydrogenase small subunit (CoxS/CutS family)
LTVNKVTHDLQVKPNWTLLYVLREVMDLTGTKYGCDRGMCGMCTVVANGQNIYACMNLAVQFNKAEIVTVEGLAQGGKLHPIQQAFLDRKAFECAWCTPGFIMTTYAFLNRTPNPTIPQIKEAVSGNACRCGTYPQVFNAIRDAARLMPP